MLISFYPIIHPTIIPIGGICFFTQNFFHCGNNRNCIASMLDVYKMGVLLHRISELPIATNVWHRTKMKLYPFHPCLFGTRANSINKSQYWPSGANKHFDIAENEEA